MTAINNNIGFSMSAGVEHVGTRSIAPSGFNDEYGYWRGNKHRTTVENKFNQIHLAFEGSGVNAGSPRVWDTQGNYYDLSGGGSWEKAGSLTDIMNESAIQERSLFLSQKGFIDVGSGVSTSPYLGVYAKFLPSGNMTDTVIAAQHRKNPAQFVLGCDGDGKFYIRSDGSISGKPVEYYAKSAKNFADYAYPVQVMGTYASGDGFLKIYVNGNFEGRSASFTRDTYSNANIKTLVGKREFPIDEQGYTGWLDELGIGNRTIGETDVKNLYYSTFDLSRYIRDDLREDIASTGSISKCGCTTLPTSVQAEITGITLPDEGTDKGAIGEKITLTYDAAATYTDGGSTVHTGIWDSGTASLACGGTVRFRLYCGASDEFYMAHDFSWMSNGEDQRASQVCSPVNIVFALAGVTSGGGGCCSDDAAAEIAVTVTGSPISQSFGGGGFGSDFLALDETYIHFVVESGVLSSDRGKSLRGEAMGETLGGAYDKTLWGTVAEHSVSSQLTFGLEPSYGTLHQLTDISVEMMVEHLTNHASGAKLSVAIDKKTTGTELNWFPSGVMVPSGSLQKITFTRPLDEEVYRLDSESFKGEFDDHQLKLTVYYPQSDEPYDGEFKIYSTKVNYGSFARVQSAVSSGSLGPPLFTKGAAVVLASGILPLFIDADIAAGSLDLFMDATLPDLIGGATLLANAGITTSNNTSLYTQGGTINLQIPLYVLGADDRGRTGFVSSDGSVNLETKGGINVFPYKQNTTTLFIKDTVSGSGLLSANMNLFLKPAPFAVTDASMNFFTKGDFNNTIPLFLKGADTSTNDATLMLKGPSAYSTSGTMNLFIKQADVFLVTSRMDAAPSVTTNSNMNLNTSGLGFPSGTIPLSMPNTIGRPTNSTTLHIEGYE
jgi:hypothetical protein